MATSLQAQLAQIAANSANPLDLKAQRKAHSQSLFFEPKVAASQDFETLYDICVEGFRNLCQVDNRFLQYSQTIFSEQSKDKDRTQLTTAENEKLDFVIEEFLSLVGSFLLLNPALRAIEWLVRRFRIHELNTQATILTFLPYHQEPFFTTLLSIVSTKLPQPLRFLTSFCQNRQIVPRQSIVLAAVQTLPFFSLLNKYVINNARRGYQYPRLTEFWSSIVSESLVGQVDMAASSSTEARQQKENDILLRVLPTLNDGLATEDPRIRQGCYVVLMVLVSKFQLSDRTLDAMEEAVGENLNSPSGDSELVCLAVLAERRKDPKLPKRVLSSILKVPRLIDTIGALTKRYNLQKLLLSITYSILDRLGKSEAREGLSFVMQVIQKGYLSKENADLAVCTLIEAADGFESNGQALPDVREYIAEMMLELVNSESVDRVVKERIQELRPEVERSLELADTTLSKWEDDSDKHDNAEFRLKDRFLENVEHVPDQIKTSSFLRDGSFGSQEQKALLNICKKAGSSASRWWHLRQIYPFKDKSKEAGQLSLTFLMFFWCGSDKAATRRHAMALAADIMKERVKSYHEDQQFILPFALIGLADPSDTVRRVAADLVAIVHQSHSDAASIKSCFGRAENLYGDDNAACQDLFADAEDAAALSGALVERLEECTLDQDYVNKVLQTYFHSEKIHDLLSKDSHDPTRENALMGLIAHITLTPALVIRTKLLALLRGISKVGGKSKTNLLLPLIRHAYESDSQELESRCQRENVSTEHYLGEIIGAISSTNKEGVKILVAIIEDDSKTPKTKLKTIAFQQVKKIWQRMKPDSRRRMAHALLNVVWNKPTETETQDAASETLRYVSIHPDIFCEFIDSFPALVSRDEEHIATTKRRKTDKGFTNGGSTAELESSMIEILQRWSFVLELIESAQEQSNVDLISRLCALLNDVHAVVATTKGHVSYIQTLLLETCNKSLGSISDSKASVNPNIVPIETIIDIFQKSSSTQVQRSALVLISTLAKMFPEVIIHHIMPVFTRMGQSVLQHADDYSVHIVDLVIQSIVPPLLASFHEQKGGSQEGMVRLLLSFVAAFEHVPPHRRLPLFSSLVEQVGANNSLHLLILLLVTKFGKSKTTEDFAANLVSRYSTVDQLLAIEKTVKLLLNATSEFPSPLSSQLLPSSNAKEFWVSIIHIISVLSRILENKGLLGRVAHDLSQNGDRIRRLYSNISEEVLKLSSSSKSHKRLSGASNSLMDSILKLLPVHESIAGLEVLLSSNEDDVLRRTLNSIEKRVREIGTGDSASQAACLELLPTLSKLLKDKFDDRLIRTCIACLDSIIERFGKKNPARVLEALGAVICPKTFTSSDKQTVEMSILCTASAVQALGEEVVPLLPKAIPLALEAVTKAMAGTPDSAVINAAYNLLATVLDSMPWAVSKQNADQILLISADVAADNHLAEKTTENRINALEILAKRSNCRDFISSLLKTWAGAVQLNQDISGLNTSRIKAALQHLKMARVVIDTSSKSSVMRHGQQMIGFFLHILELPTQHVQMRMPLIESEVEEIVSFAADCMVAMVYKLNDSSFRPLFSSLVEWANGGISKAGGSQKMRQYALYTFLVRFFGTLKSIVTSYMGTIIGESTALLTQELSMTDKSESERYYEHRLWCRILETLRQALDNDADEYFQAPARFIPLCSALVTQLERIPILATQIPSHVQDENQQDLLEGHVIPTIVALASAADAAENTKNMNRALLKQMRSNKPEVRASAIHCQQMLVEKLGEDWLANLPEMLPAVSEVLEDEDEEVMGEARKWVTAVESVLGESLEGMLQ